MSIHIKFRSAKIMCNSYSLGIFFCRSTMGISCRSIGNKSKEKVYGPVGMCISFHNVVGKLYSEYTFFLQRITSFFQMPPQV